MRYVVLIVALAIFVIWDNTRNDSRYIHKAGRFLVQQIERAI